VLRRPPLGLGAPVWADDEAFDPSHHVIEAHSRSLAAIVDESMSEPLARDRPLWQLRIARQLDDGRIGVVGKAHHCMVDGIAAVEMASLLFDPEPDAPDPEPDDWRPAPPPRARKLIAATAAGVVRAELEVARRSAQLVASPGQAVGRLRRAGTALVDAARPATPHDQLNSPISPHRRLGLLRRPLTDLAAIKTEFEVKLNDVILAVCAGGVRRFLSQRGDAAVSLKAMVPVSVRPDAGGPDLGNQISFMFVDLPCDEPDPIRRLNSITAATRARKDAGEPKGASDVLGSIGLAPPPIRDRVSRLAASPHAFNLVVSNIPGPREPLYMRGCRLAEAYPVVPIADRHALSIGVTTLADDAFFGLYADRESLPDVDALADCIDVSIDELCVLGATPSRFAELATMPPG